LLKEIEFLFIHYLLIYIYNKIKTQNVRDVCCALSHLWCLLHIQ